MITQEERKLIEQYRALTERNKGKFEAFLEKLYLEEYRKEITMYIFGNTSADSPDKS